LLEKLIEENHSKKKKTHEETREEEHGRPVWESVDSRDEGGTSVASAPGCEAEVG